MATKSEIRKEILRNLSNHDRAEKAEKDRIIKAKLQKIEEFKNAKIIAFYVALKNEVNTEALIDEALATGKRVVVPSVNSDNLEMYAITDRETDLVAGPCGVLQPVAKEPGPFPKENIDLIIVPGVAFTKNGNRLGRGKGFYDRFLNTLPPRTKKIGLAYDIQIIENLPTTPQDFPVDAVVTN